MLKSRSGAHMYAQGFGTWQSAPGVVYSAVCHVIKTGYRLIDCAPAYFNLEEVGKAINDSIKEGIVRREDLHIVSKVWNCDHSPSHVIGSVQAQVEELSIGYIDTLLMHWPVAFERPKGMDGYKYNAESFRPVDKMGNILISDIPIIDTWNAMEDCVNKGLVCDIGVCNFTLNQLEALIKNPKLRMHPSVLQVECHPGLPQFELRDFCRQHGMVFMAFSPLAFGYKNSAPSLFEDPDIQAIAYEAYGRTVDPATKLAARLLLQWSSQMGNVCLSKSTTPSRIESNSKTPYGGLSEDVMHKLNNFHKVKPRRAVNPKYTRDGLNLFDESS